MHKPSKTVDRQTLAMFWQASMKYKKDLIATLSYPAGTILLSTVVPLYVGKILAALANPKLNVSHYIYGFVIAAALGLLGNRIGFVALMRFQAKTMGYLQARILDVLLSRSVGFHNNNISGKLVSDAIDYPTAFNNLSGAIFINILPFTVTLVAGVIIVSFASTTLGLIVAAMAIFTIGSAIIDSRRRLPLRFRRLAASKAVTSHLADTIVNMQTVKTFAKEPAEIKEHARLSKTLTGMRQHDWSLAAANGNNRMIVLMTLQLVYILLITSAVHRNPALLGIGIFAFSLTITIGNRLFEINSMIRNVEDGFLNASPMTEIMLDAPEILDEPKAPELDVNKGEIILASVNFKYNDTDNEQVVFEGLNLDIKAGEKLGLVGPSGGGKSTLTRLLLRFEDVDEGQILIDGQNIAKVTQASLRRKVAYVPQEPLLFHRTIGENIAYANSQIKHDQIVKAAKLAHADEFIQELPQKYDTIVGERGVKLSGGQRQRIAIARALLKDAPILILDEATSALDSQSEVLIQDALWKLMQNRTTIVIAHRLSTIQKMDRIIVMDNGEISEEGTHHELIDKNGLYARLWAHQSGGFLEE